MSPGKAEVMSDIEIDTDLQEMLDTKFRWAKGQRGRSSRCPLCGGLPKMKTITSVFYNCEGSRMALRRYGGKIYRCPEIRGETPADAMVKWERWVERVRL